MESPSYNEFIQAVAKEHLVRLSWAISVTNAFDSETDNYENYEEDYENSKQNRLKTIAELIADDSNQCFGTEDDFHNLTVSYARVDMFDCACKILNRGLSYMPYSVDLLADFVKYGISCGEYQLCEEYSNRLEHEVSRNRWNWRAYSFSIDFLLHKCVRESATASKSYRKKAIMLANSFINSKNTDQAYYDKSNIYRSFGDSVREYDTLLEGFKVLKVSTKCALRLADIEFERGDFTEAILHIKRCINTIKPQPEISRAYAYLLLALGNTSILFDKNKDTRKFSDDETLINDIYRDFHTAKENGLSGVYKETTDTVIKTIFAQTSIEYPYTDSDDKYDF